MAKECEQEHICARNAAPKCSNVAEEFLRGVLVACVTNRSRHGSCAKNTLERPASQEKCGDEEEEADDCALARTQHAAGEHL